MAYFLLLLECKQTCRVWYFFKFKNPYVIVLVISLRDVSIFLCACFVVLLFECKNQVFVLTVETLNQRNKVLRTPYIAVVHCAVAYLVGYG